MKLIAFILFTLCSSWAWANPFIFTQKQNKLSLTIEVLQNRGLHFSLTSTLKSSQRIWTTPMVLKETLLLDTSAQKQGNKIENNDFIVTVDEQSLCVNVFDKHQQIDIIKNCPLNPHNAWKGLTLESAMTKNLYGLGQYFTNPGTADGDLVGRVWDPLYNSYGNSLRGFSKGANSYAMFPVLYSLGEGKQNFLFFYDNIYKQMWSLKQKPFKVESYGDEIRWFVFTQQDVKSLRQKYMHLTGHAPVPKKDVFGLWISEFGYESWNEIQEEIDHLRAHGFPLDGAALDLQWFGGSFYEGNVDRSGSRFGTLSFDTKNFPHPKETIEDFQKRQGVSLMAIEESYISKYLPEHKALADHTYLAHHCYDKAAIELTSNPWWGIGGMIDWTNNQAGDFWHDLKRKKLTDLGISHHWTDLGEPEMYDASACYYGFPKLNKHHHADIHNIYNFKWLESIARGYRRNKESVRPFMMSRSGTSGIQRFGAGFWSGDIGANMQAMTAHYNAQMHMSFSGIDYYGADIGGFHRSSYSLDGDPNVLFTQWFANAALFDFPIRSHTWNLANNLETSPSKIGDVASNLANIKLRYKLFPYYYSLSHQAYLTGTGIINPMPLVFPEDLNLRQMGNQKMIGEYLLGAMIARYGESERNVYLPAGRWFNFHTGDLYQSQGQTVYAISAYPHGFFQIPLFVKAGAIIPTMTIDNKTMNISGKREDHTIKNDLSFIIVPSHKKTSFTLYEDDGVSVNYQQKQVNQLVITQQLKQKTLEINFSKIKGSYQAMPLTRMLKLTFYAQAIQSASFNRQKLKVMKEGKNKFSIQVSEVHLSKENKFRVNLLSL